MKRNFAFTMAFLLMFVLTVLSTNQASKQTPPNSSAASKGIMLRLPSDALWITLDDKDNPFLLSNLDERFDSSSMISFLEEYVDHCAKKKTLPSIIVSSQTKRVVDGEEAFDECLKRLASERSVTVVFLPPPTGHDPNMDLRSFSKELNGRNSDANKR
jgi:hypothetical protein